MRVLIGKIVKPQGIKGELKIYPNDDKLNQFKKISNISFSENGELIKVKNWAVRNGFFYVTLPGVNDRDIAEKYRNKNVYVDEEEINLNPDTYFTEDIIGCDIYDENDNFLGAILDIENYGATDIFVILEDGREVMVPFATRIFVEINTNDKKIVAKRDLYDGAKVWK